MARFTDEYLERILQRSDYRCHVCREGGFTVENFGVQWHRDHVVPRAKGGTNHIRNLKAACVGCNLHKGVRSARSVRRENGYRSAPLSTEEKRKRTLRGAAAGAAAGAPFGQPIIGAVLGAIFNRRDPR